MRPTLLGVKCLAWLLPIALALPACGGSGSGQESGPTGPCETPGEPSVQLGTGKGAAYEAMAPGQVVELFFGSQSGMEGQVTIRTAGVPLSQLATIETTLLVSGSSVGQSVHRGQDCACRTREEGERIVGEGEVDASVLVDVVPHPEVANVVQLDGREAELHVVLLGQATPESETEQLAEQRLPVVLTLR